MINAPISSGCRFLTLLTVVVLLFACQEQKDPKLEEAAKIHNEATAIAEDIEPQIEAIDSLQNRLAEEKKNTTDVLKTMALDSASASLLTLAQAFEAWEQNIIEVPGMVHEHGEGDHHHEHKPAPNVTPEQMVELQKEMKANIEKIKVDLNKAEDALKRVLQ